MGNYAGSRTNALVNSVAVDKNASVEERNKMFENATEVAKKAEFKSRSAKEHNHAK